METINGATYYEDHALAATHDRRAMHHDKRAAFMKRFGLRESRSGKHPLWLAMLPRGLRKYGGAYGWPELRGPDEAYTAMRGASLGGIEDHAELFTRRGGYVYTTQPYDVRVEYYQAVYNYWTGLGLFVGISIADAWWWPGRTPLIVIAHEPLELTSPEATEGQNEY